MRDEIKMETAKGTKRIREKTKRSVRKRLEAEEKPKRFEKLFRQTSGHKAGKQIVKVVNGVEYVFRWCPAGKFWMGSPENESGRLKDEKQHHVTLTQGFWMLETQVTQAMWKSVMGTTIQEQARQMLQDNTIYNFSERKKCTLRDFYGFKKDENPEDVLHGVGSHYPMYYVNWEESQAFCRRLSNMTGMNFQLPTEAQWEYACRAGTTKSTYAEEMKIKGRNNAPILDSIAWYGGNCCQNFSMAKSRWNSSSWPETQYPGGLCGAHEVGTKDANAWGLYDMLGNVLEWCRDWYGDYSGNSVTDPTGATSGTSRMARGGGWGMNAKFCRSADRSLHMPTERRCILGFRVILFPVVPER